MPDETFDEPVLILQGGTDELLLEEGGKVYRPGDRMPKSLSHERRLSLQAAGIRFETRHPEPVLTPGGAPAEMAAAEQIDPPPGGPAVVAAVEDVPKDDVGGADIRAPQEPAPRAPRKGSD